MAHQRDAQCAGCVDAGDLGVKFVVVPFDLYLALDSNQSAEVRNDLTDPTLLLEGELDGGGQLAVSVVDPIDEPSRPIAPTKERLPRSPSTSSPS